MRFLFFLLFGFSSFAQQVNKVDFTSVLATISVDTVSKSISGDVKYDFMLKNAIDSIRIDAKNMTFSNVTINDKLVNFKNNGKELILFEGFNTGENTLDFYYQAKPKQALYFVKEQGELQIWTQGQGKYTSHWLPSFDDVNEKLIFNFNIVLDSDKTALTNGVLKFKDVMNQKTIWKYRMEKPMSSYLAMLVIGNFEKKTALSQSKIPLEYYLKPSDSSKFETTFKNSKSIFNFLEKEIGFKYPWKIYRQIPIQDFLYAGMENTTSTTFEQNFVVDSNGYNDENYENVNAHELAHQWFGDLITAQSSKDHWLQEGFATYYELLAEKHIFGEDYFYSKLVAIASDIQNASAFDTIPMLHEKASSLSYYKKGAFALHVLNESIGTAKFKLAIKNYLHKYQFRSVTTNDFLSEIKKVAPSFDTQKFKTNWLTSATYNEQNYLPSLQKWKQFEHFQLIEENKNANLEKLKSDYLPLLASKSVHFSVKVAILNSLLEYSFLDKEIFLNAAISDYSINVQKAIAANLDKYVADFKEKVFTIYNLPSYAIKTIILNLEYNNLEDLSALLNKSEEFSKNNAILRINWLSVALKTQNYQESKKQKWQEELNNFTSTNFDASTRMVAFSKIDLLQKENSIALANLFLATNHYNWQLVKFAKKHIELFVNQPNSKEIIIALKQESKPELQQIIQKYLEFYSLKK